MHELIDSDGLRFGALTRSGERRPRVRGDQAGR
jgi:hypothetical protein